MSRAAPNPAVRATRRRRLWPKLVLLAGVSAVMAVGCELVVRAVDGFELWSLRLTPKANRSDTGADVARDVTTPFLQRPEFGAAAMDPAWFAVTPPPVPRQPVPAAMAAVFAAGYFDMFNYQWNERLLRSLWIVGKGPSIAQDLPHPDSFWVFAPIDGASVFPRYRFPQSVTLPSGVTLNSFGFRGRETTVDKPAHVVRIGCVGASTTVDDHQVAHSYPELLEGFLDAWASAKQLGVDFEVINAGCEGYSSTDIAETVRHYLLPLAVDYVIYYEGANQLQMPHLMRHLRIDGETPPKPSKAGFLDAKAAAHGDHQWLYQHLASARRLQTVLAGSTPIGEPQKPPQHIELPDGLDPSGGTEPAIDLTRADEVLALGPILSDLDRIATDTAAANVQLVMTSYRWFVHQGLTVHPVTGDRIWGQLNDDYWPVSYASLRRFADLENEWFAAWAKARSVPFLDVAAVMPDDERLHTDAIHKTAIGSRCHAWAVAALLIPQLERDLAAGRTPTPDTHIDAHHPNIPPMRQKSYAEFDVEVGR